MREMRNEKEEVLREKKRKEIRKTETSSLNSLFSTFLFSTSSLVLIQKHQNFKSWFF